MCVFAFFIPAIVINQTKKPFSTLQVNYDGDPMDDDSHGTHCAGIIGAQKDNSVGISGTIAPTQTEFILKSMQILIYYPGYLSVKKLAFFVAFSYVKHCLKSIL